MEIKGNQIERAKALVEQGERAKALVEQGERAVGAALAQVRDAQYADGPRAYEERSNANRALSKANTALALYKAQLASLEREVAQQVPSCS